MKATGVIRQIDDLGRIVIPMELRKIMRIRERDPFEIFTEDDGSIIIKKYTPDDFSAIASRISQSMFKTLKHPILICDMHIVLGVVGDDTLNKELHDRRISESLFDNCMNVLKGRPMRDIFCPVEFRRDVVTFLSVPVITDSRDVIGSISLLGDEATKVEPDDIIRFQMAAAYIGDQFE